MKIPITTLSKNSIRGLYGIPEATTLLSRVLDHGGFSRNTLGDTTHNTNKIELNWVGGSVWWANLCGSYGGGGGGWPNQMERPKRNTKL